MAADVFQFSVFDRIEQLALYLELMLSLGYFTYIICPIFVLFSNRELIVVFRILAKMKEYVTTKVMMSNVFASLDILENTAR